MFAYLKGKSNQTYTAMKKLLLLFILAFAYQNIVYSQSCLPDGIIFISQEQVDNFQINHPDCTEIEGDVKFNGGLINNLDSLIVLTSIGGDLWFLGANQLDDLTGLDSVTSIGGNLKFEAIGLYYLTGLGQLVSIGGSLEIYQSHFINFTGLENLVSIGGDLNIGYEPWKGNPYLTDLTGLNNLNSIGGDIVIMYNAMLSNLTGLESLTSLAGNLRIGGISTGSNPSLSSLTGLQNLVSIEE